MVTDEQRPEDPREALDETVWAILVNAYCRAASGGALPRRQEDRNEIVAPFASEMKHDYEALKACMDQAGVIMYSKISAAAPPRPHEPQ